MGKIKFTDYIKEGIPTKYELIMLASQRVQDINNGSPSFFYDSKHKSTVMALEEVEKEFVDISELREQLINSLQELYQDEELQVDYNLEQDDAYQVDLIDSGFLDKTYEDQEDGVEI